MKETQKPKISNEARKFAQMVVHEKKSDEEINDLLSKNIKLLGEKDLIWQKIQGIRKNNEQQRAGLIKKGKIAPEIMVKQPVVKTKTEDKLPEKPAVEKQANGGKVLWDGSTQAKDKPQRKEVIRPEERIGPHRNPAKNSRGTIVSLMEATRGKHIKRKVKELKGKNTGIKVETCIYAGMRDALGIEVSLEEAKITETDGILTLSIGDLRITGVPEEEVSENKLRGLFNLDVVSTQRSDGTRRALYPKLAFRKHLNGDKPVYIATVNQEKMEPAPGSYHTTPSFNGYFVHLELKAE